MRPAGRDDRDPPESFEKPAVQTNGPRGWACRGGWVEAAAAAAAAGEVRVEQRETVQALAAAALAGAAGREAGSFSPCRGIIFAGRCVSAPGCTRGEERFLMRCTGLGRFAAMSFDEARSNMHPTVRRPRPHARTGVRAVLAHASASDALVCIEFGEEDENNRI